MHHRGLTASGAGMPWRTTIAAQAFALLIACDSFSDPVHRDGDLDNPGLPAAGAAGGISNTGNVGGGGGLFVGSGGFAVAAGGANAGGAPVEGGGFTEMPGAVEPQAFGISLGDRVDAMGLAGGGVDRILIHPEGGVVVAGEDFIEDRPGLSIVRIGPDRTTLWSRWFETGWGRLGGIAVHPDGRLLLAGTFFGVLEIDGHRIESTIDRHVQPMDPSPDAFLMILDEDGTVTTLRRFGGVGQQAAQFLFAAPDGGFVFGAVFTGRMELGDLELTSSFGALGSNIAFVRLNDDGVPVTARAIGIDSNVSAAAIDSAGNVILGGWAFARSTEELDLGPSWILKVDSEGTPLWSRALDPQVTFDPTAIAVDGEDAILLATNAGYGSLFGQPLLNYSFALAKLAKDGSPLWVRPFGTNIGSAYAIAIGGDDSITLAGYFGEFIDFGGGALTTFGFPDTDLFVAQLDQDGSHRFSLSAGAKWGSDYARALAIDEVGSIVVAGYLSDEVDFGSGAFKTPHNAFIAWIDP